MNKLNHIAFIMDGNGRWGKKRSKGRNFGHLKGVDTVKKIVNGALKLNVPILTFYVFSSENWKRPKTEIRYLFKLIDNYFSKEIKSVNQQGIRINILGDKKKLSANLKKTLSKSMRLTFKNKKILVNLAINYGSRNEILNAAKNLRKNINEKNFERKLYTKNIKNPDILIRTGGHKRLSNFMLWQLAYTELFFLKKLWPDFSVKDLKTIVNKFKKIKRNFGSL
tara:strand:+ start:1613 stop:2281 length:669 start_codon:yes stop_codon:yes gene_type:complete